MYRIVRLKTRHPKDPGRGGAVGSNDIKSYFANPEDTGGLYWVYNGSWAAKFNTEEEALFALGLAGFRVGTRTVIESLLAPLGVRVEAVEDGHS